MHPRAVFGKNCIISQGVTVGDDNKGGIPKIGNNVFIGANAVLIGNIFIDDNVKIGAGAVVNKSVNKNCTVVGNPMLIINRK